MLVLLALLACGGGASDARGVYRAGPNAVIPGAHTGELKLWGPDGTVTRVPTPAPGGHTFVGQGGPLWRVDRDVPAPERAFPVDAAVVERIGFRFAELLGTSSTGAVDPAKAGGTFVRSAIKVRRKSAPPVYVAAATGDEVGAGRLGGPADVRAGKNCEAAVALLDHKAEKLLSGVKLDVATRLCAVPVVSGPVDLDGDGDQDFLVHGQNQRKGFRAWFTLKGETLVAGPAESVEDLP
jgi:hypothetical protein